MDENAIDRVKSRLDEIKPVLDEMNRVWGEWYGANETALAEMTEAAAEVELAKADRSRRGSEFVPKDGPKALRDRARAALSDVRAGHLAHMREITGNMRRIREGRAREAAPHFEFIRVAHAEHAEDPEGATWLAYIAVGLLLLDTYPDWTPASEADQVMLEGARSLRASRGAEIREIIEGTPNLVILVPGTSTPVKRQLLHRAASEARLVAARNAGSD